MNRKGIGVGQVFVFIVAGITFSLIMIFGYKAIAGFVSSGEQVSFVQFKTDLESSVQRIYTEFGSVRVREFTLPATYHQICFVDLDVEYTPAKHSALRENDFLASSVWERATEEGRGYDEENVNVFLTPPAPVPIKVFRISMDDDFLCLDIKNGKFTLVLEGKGDRTYLREPPALES